MRLQSSWPRSRLQNASRHTAHTAGERSEADDDMPKLTSVGAFLAAAMLEREEDQASWLSAAPAVLRSGVSWPSANQP